MGFHRLFRGFEDFGVSRRERVPDERRKSFLDIVAEVDALASAGARLASWLCLAEYQAVFRRDVFYRAPAEPPCLRHELRVVQDFRRERERVGGRREVVYVGAVEFYVRPSEFYEGRYETRRPAEAQPHALAILFFEDSAAVFYGLRKRYGAEDARPLPRVREVVYPRPVRLRDVVFHPPVEHHARVEHPRIAVAFGEGEEGVYSVAYAPVYEITGGALYAAEFFARAAFYLQSLEPAAPFAQQRMGEGAQLVAAAAAVFRKSLLPMFFMG